VDAAKHLADLLAEQTEGRSDTALNKQAKGQETAAIVSESDRESFVAEHLCMARLGASDATLAANCGRYLFHADKLSVTPQAFENKWRIAAYHFEDLYAGWAMLPILDPKKAAGMTWEDVAMPKNSDNFFMFFLNGAGFRLYDLRSFRAATRMRKQVDDLFCPYLSIQWESELSAAMSRFVVVGSAALYARVLLRLDADECRKGTEDGKGLGELRYYGISVSRERYFVWYLAPFHSGDPAKPTGDKSQPVFWKPALSTAPTAAQKSARPSTAPNKSSSAGRLDQGDTERSTTTTQKPVSGGLTKVATEHSTATRPMEQSAKPSSDTGMGAKSQSASATWEGCRLYTLVRGKSCERRELEDLVNWVNAIHNWGQHQHADAVTEDLMAFIAGS